MVGCWRWECETRECESWNAMWTPTRKRLSLECVECTAGMRGTRGPELPKNTLRPVPPPLHSQRSPPEIQDQTPVQSTAGHCDTVISSGTYTYGTGQEQQRSDILLHTTHDDTQATNEGSNRGPDRFSPTKMYSTAHQIRTTPLQLPAPLSRT
jgi:hypothetical protein